VSSSHRFTLLLSEGGDIYQSWSPFGGDETPVHLNTRGLKFLDVSAGKSHALAISEKKQLFSWGKASCLGVMGHGDDSTRSIISPKLINSVSLEQFCRIEAGVPLSAAVSIRGTIFMWGSMCKFCLSYSN